MNVSPRYASLISQVPPLWQGLGMQGPAEVGSSSSEATSTTLEQLGSVKPSGHSQVKESSDKPDKQMPPFSHGLGSQLSPLQNWGTQKLSPTKSQAATEECFMIPASLGLDPGWTGEAAGGSAGGEAGEHSPGSRRWHRRAAATPPLAGNSGRCLLPAALPSTNSWRGREGVGGPERDPLLPARWRRGGRARELWSQRPLRGVGPRRGGVREPGLWSPSGAIRVSAPRAAPALLSGLLPGLLCSPCGLRAADLENNEA